jgi:hypothetical protein
MNRLVERLAIAVLTAAVSFGVAASVTWGRTTHHQGGITVRPGGAVWFSGPYVYCHSYIKVLDCTQFSSGSSTAYQKYDTSISRAGILVLKFDASGHELWHKLLR